MLDLAIATHVLDPLEAEREALVVARRRADRDWWLAFGGFCGCLLFVMTVGWWA